MSAYHIRAWCLWMIEECVRSSGTAGTDGCELPCGCWNWAQVLCKHSQCLKPLSHLSSNNIVCLLWIEMNPLSFYTWGFLKDQSFPECFQSWGWRKRDRVPWLDSWDTHFCSSVRKSWLHMGPHKPAQGWGEIASVNYPCLWFTLQGRPWVFATQWLKHTRKVSKKNAEDLGSI